MGNVAYTPSYRTTVVDAGDNIIFDSTQRGPNIALMLVNETGDVGSKDTDNVILEDDSGDIHLEEIGITRYTTIHLFLLIELIVLVQMLEIYYLQKN